jgi:hypothetical protein
MFGLILNILLIVLHVKGVANGALLLLEVICPYLKQLLICDIQIVIETKLGRLFFAKSRWLVLSSLNEEVFGQRRHVVEAPALSEVLFLAHPLQVKES